MTETETPAVVEITPGMQRIIEHMLVNSRIEYYANGIAGALHIANATAGTHLRTMLAAGWLVDRMVPTPGGRAPRRYYKFTPGTARMLRRVLREG